VEKRNSRKRKRGVKHLGGKHRSKKVETKILCLSQGGGKSCFEKGVYNKERSNWFFPKEGDTLKEKHEKKRDVVSKRSQKNNINNMGETKRRDRTTKGERKK